MASAGFEIEKKNRRKKMNDGLSSHTTKENQSNIESVSFLRFLERAIKIQLREEDGERGNMNGADALVKQV